MPGRDDTFNLEIAYADLPPGCYYPTDDVDFNTFIKEFDNFPFIAQLKEYNNGSPSKPSIDITDYKELSICRVSIQGIESDPEYLLFYGPIKAVIGLDGNAQSSLKYILHGITYSTKDTKIIKHFVKVFFDRDTENLKLLCGLMEDNKIDEFEEVLKGTG
jgi:hypothetical protein